MMFEMKLALAQGVFVLSYLFIIDSNSRNSMNWWPNDGMKADQPAKEGSWSYAESTLILV